MLDDEEQRFDDFLVNNEGVFYLVRREDREEQIIHVCSPLIVVAITRNSKGTNWGKLFSLVDPEGHEKQHHIRNTANHQTVIAELVHKGLTLSGHPRARTLLLQYIRSLKTKQSLLSSDKPGWVGNSFVLPDASFGPEQIMYSGGYRDHGFGASGDWKTNIGKFCSGNSRLILAASAALAAPLLSILNMEGGGFHLRGDAAAGKTTALEVAASVYGSASSYLLNWDATKNSLEQVAEAHNDCLMVIDELGLVDSSTVGDAIYMLANGLGKARMGQTKRRWRVMFLTSGEVSLAEHMAKSGKDTKKGQEVRLLDIAADAGAGMGLFERLHSFGTPAEFANYLKAATRKHYGTPLLKFLKIITAARSEIEAECHAQIDSFVKRLLPANAPGEVPRALRRFGIVAAAGEIATAHKLTGWKPGESIAAAEKCFAAWMEHRRTFDPVARAIDAVCKFILENESRFEVVGGDPIEDKVGYRKKSAYLILPDVFKDFVCAGAKVEEVAEALERAGYLNTSGKNRLKKQERIGGELVYVYSISDKILEAG